MGEKTIIGQKYNFIVFGQETGCLKVAYNDLNYCENAVYIPGINSNSNLIKTVYNIHTSPRLNNYFHLPFQHIWKNLLFANKFNNQLPYCFVFFGCDIRRIESGLIEYLRREYTNCKVVAFCQDLVKTYGGLFEKYRNKYDVILSFDKEDAYRNDLIYYPLVYSKIDVEDDDMIPASDVFFVGKDKNRLSLIIETYYRLVEMGKKCDFYITGVDRKKIIDLQDVKYVDGLDYYTALKHIKKTKCILEIVQDGGSGNTIRYAEALTYGKKLLTNCQKLSDDRYNEADFILKFSDPSEIHFSFLEEPMKPVPVDIQRALSPVCMLEYLCQLLD